MKPYVSLDIETTGLDASEHQILEIAMVAELDSNIAVEELPHLVLIVKHQDIYGQPFALWMNADLIKMIAGKKQPRGHLVEDGEVRDRMTEWLTGTMGERSRLVVAGKNVAGFDVPFLRNAGYDPGIFHHRTLDPAALYIEPEDHVPPGLAQCMERAGLQQTNAHEALSDARDVIGVLRRRGVLV